MAVDFPALRPTSRSFSAPSWPTTSVRSQSGTISRRLWGTQPSQATLQLGFANVTDADAAAILDAYSSSRGGMEELTLPDEVFTEVSTTLKPWLDGSGYSESLRWYFAEGEAPQVESVFENRSSVTIKLTAELRV